MAHGSHENVERAGFVRTPPAIAQHCRQMVTLPEHDPFSVGDLTCGKGDLLLPFWQSNARMVGTELSKDRAEAAAKALPGAEIYATAIEHMHLPPECLGLVLANPPYLRADGTRTELPMLRRMLRYLMKHGVLIAIVPMRQWDAHMVDLFAKHFYDIQAFKFPDLPTSEEAAFDLYTQAVIIGKKRAVPIKTPDELLVTEMKGWRYRTKGIKPGESPWVQGFPLPDLPELPWPDAGRYCVPVLKTEPKVTVFHASHAEIHEALSIQGIQTTETWQRAVTYRDQRRELCPSVMPLVGKVHLAALILGTGLLDHRILMGPDGNEYMFSSFITTRWQKVEIDEDEEARQVVEKKQLQDLPILGVLNLSTGTTEHYYGAEAYNYLDPWYPILAKIILEEYQPIYDLNPDDWMIKVALSTATDKTLPGGEPGLAIAQMHRVFAHWYATALSGKVAFQGERGVGKTRVLIVLMALYMHYWVNRNNPAFLSEQKIKRRPRWLKRLRIDWKKSRWTKGEEPHALPLAIVTPKRVTTTWVEELEAAWPAAKVLIIRSYHDVDTWMDLAATGSCLEKDRDGHLRNRTFEAVVAIFSQSATRAMQLDWGPAVIEVPQGTKVVNDLEADGIPEFNEAGRLIAKWDRETGELLTKVVAYSHFYCPTCGGLIEASPRSLRHRTEEEGIDEEVLDEQLEDELQPVEHIDWFALQPRWCQHPLSLRERRGSQAEREHEQVCGAPLWTKRRREEIEKKYPRLSFVQWAQGIAARAKRLAAGEPDVSVAAPTGKRKIAASHNPLAPSRYSRLVDSSGAVMEAPAGSFSPYDYFQHYYSGCCAFVGLDEYHNMFGVNSDVARAGHHIINASHSSVPASGTFWEGLDKFFYGWFRFVPEFWKSLGIGWNDLGKAVRDYGVVMKLTKEYVVARKGTPEIERSTTVKPASGISARFLPLILPYMIFLDILDVGAHMPPKEEVPVIVDLHDPQIAELRTAWEAELAEAKRMHEEAEREYKRLGEAEGVSEAELIDADFAQAEALQRVQAAEEALTWVRAHDMEGTYREMEAELRSRMKAGDTAVQIQMQTLLARWCAYPFDPPLTITHTLRGEWGEKRGEQIVYTAPTLAWDCVTPMERRLIEIVDAERHEVIEGSNPPRTRVCLIFYRQTTKRNVGARLASLLTDYNPWVLPDNTPPEEREHAILKAVADGHGVILAPISKVSEGLNLKLDTAILYELGKNAKESDQAVGRCWRLGKEELVRAYYFAGQDTATHDKVRKQASASGAASLFSGNSPRGEMAAFVGADKVALAKVAQKLETVEDLTAAFARRRAEWEAAVSVGAREFLGYDDDPLPARVEVWRARLACEAAERAACPIDPVDSIENGVDGTLTASVKTDVEVPESEYAAVASAALSIPEAIHHTPRSVPAFTGGLTWDQAYALVEQMKAEQRRKRAKPKSTNNAASKIVEREPVQASLFDLLG
jgi:hypothetical protein